jgi:hypothetical protein
MHNTYGLPVAGVSIFPPFLNFFCPYPAASPALAHIPQKFHTISMDSGQVIYISSRLVLGALASFFAIMLWSKTRDVAWMLMVAGTIAAYVETVYSILELFGITGEGGSTIGSMRIISIVLPCLPMVFFIAAFMVMIIRKYRQR